MIMAYSINLIMYVVVPVLYFLTFLEIKKYIHLPYRGFWMLDVIIGFIYPILHVATHAYIYIAINDAEWENLGHKLFIGYNYVNAIFYIVTGVVTYLSIKWQGKWLSNYQPRHHV